MKICNYCYSKNLNESNNCYHCKAPLFIERKVLRKNNELNNTDLYYVNYYGLQKFNFIELLELLAMARREKNKFYQKDKDDNEQTDVYKILRKQTKLIENVLLDSMGRIPARIIPNEISRYNKLRLKSVEKHNKLLKLLNGE